MLTQSKFQIYSTALILNPSFRMCKCAKKNTKINRDWIKCRTFLLNIVESKKFEGFIIICILISSILLTFNDVNLKVDSLASKVLSVFDYLFRLIFIVEMILKWIAYGLKRYFSDWWCILDFIIVIVGIFNIIFEICNIFNS